MPPDAAGADAAPTDGRRLPASDRGSGRRKDADRDRARGRARAATPHGRMRRGRAAISGAAAEPHRPAGRPYARGVHPATMPTKRSWMTMTRSRIGMRTLPAGRSDAGTSPALPAVQPPADRVAGCAPRHGREPVPARPADQPAAGRRAALAVHHSVQTARPRPVGRATAGSRRARGDGAARGCVPSPGRRAPTSNVWMLSVLPAQP
jgi:hypothetical protein